MLKPALPPLTAQEAEQQAALFERAYVPAAASQAGALGVSFLSAASDGAATGRIPEGWDEEGIVWAPFCGCVPVHTFPIDCEDCPTIDHPGFPDNPNTPGEICCKATARPFLIEIDEFENACSIQDRAEYARLNLQYKTPITIAQYAHAAMRANAIDVSGGWALSPNKAAGVLRSNRLLPGSLWVPSVAADMFADAGVFRLASGRAVDNFGVRAFIGPGIPNVGPDGTPAPPGTAWTYISAPGVDYAVTDIEITDNEIIRGNAKCPHAERKGIVRVDPCDIYAQLVTLEDGCETEITP